jgi:hypothetical protein
MAYYLGRSVEYHDIPAVRTIVQAAAKNNYRFSSIVMGVINSDQFKMITVPNNQEIGSL